MSNYDIKTSKIYLVDGDKEYELEGVKEVTLEMTGEDIEPFNFDFSKTATIQCALKITMPTYRRISKRKKAKIRNRCKRQLERLFG